MTPTLDSFNRANEDPAAGWTSVLNNLKVLSNQGAANAVNVITVYSSVAADCDVFMTVAVKPANTFAVGVNARAKDTGSVLTLDCYYWGFDALSGTDNLVLSRIDNLVETRLSVVGFEVTAGDQLKLVCRGSALEGWLYTGGVWSLKATATDATYAAGGYIGVTMTDTTSRVDDFGGGALIDSRDRGESRGVMRGVAA